MSIALVVTTLLFGFLTITNNHQNNKDVQSSLQNTLDMKRSDTSDGVKFVGPYDNGYFSVIHKDGYDHLYQRTVYNSNWNGVFYEKAISEELHKNGEEIISATTVDDAHGSAVPSLITYNNDGYNIYIFIKKVILKDKQGR